MSNSPNKNGKVSNGESNEIRTINHQRNGRENSPEIRNREGTITNSNNINNIRNISSFRANSLQPQHSEISINGGEISNNNILSLNINVRNNLNREDSALSDEYYNQNEDDNQNLFNPLIEQINQNPGLAIDTLILNLNSVINNEK